MPRPNTSFSLTQDALALGRHLALDTARRLQHLKPVTRQFADTGAALAQLACQSSEDLARQQLSVIEQGLELASKRLKRAGEADNPRQLLQDERRLLPESAARLRGEIATLAHIYFDTRAKFNLIARDAIDELGCKLEPAAPTPSRRGERAPRKIG